MLITFISDITTNGKTNQIKFTAPVAISKWQKFLVLEFEEPSMKEKNRIEVTEDAVNIITGPNTLNLSLGEIIPIKYLIKGHGEIYFESQLHHVNLKKDKIKFQYSLSNQGQLIGEYKIQLLITK